MEPDRDAVGALQVGVVLERGVLVGEVEITLRDARWWHPRHWLPRRRRFTNLVTNGGRNVMARLLAGTSSDIPNYFELGTGTTTPAAADVALTTPDAATWKAIGAASVISSVYAMFEATYGTGEANGTWQELGMWAGSTAVAGSGTLFSHVLSEWTKTSSQTATVSWRILFSV